MRARPLMRWTAPARGTHRCESDRSPDSRRRVSCPAMASSSRRVARSERDCAASHSAAQTAAAGMGLAIMGDQSRDLAIESDQTGTLVTLRFDLRGSQAC